MLGPFSTLSLGGYEPALAPKISGNMKPGCLHVPVGRRTPEKEGHSLESPFSQEVTAFK